MFRVSFAALFMLIAACSRREPAPETTTSKPVAVASSTPPAAPLEPMAIGGEVTAPVVVKRTNPAWPELPTAQRFWLFSLVVTKEGSVKDLQLVKGDRGVHSRLAEEAIREWEFKPGTYRGRPVDVRYHLSITLHAR